MTFTTESDFEDALVELLSHKGWEKNVLMYPTEKVLLANWASILYDNNPSIDDDVVVLLGDFRNLEGVGDEVAFALQSKCPGVIAVVHSALQQGFEQSGLDHHRISLR